MNSIAPNINLRKALNVPPEERNSNLRLQWDNMGKKHKRVDRSASAIFQHPDNARLFVTPYAYEYFKETLPNALPENSKVSKAIIVTDLDIKLWHRQLSRPPLDAFNDLTEGYHSDIQERSKLEVFLEKAFTQKMRHMPQVLFYNSDDPVAVVVLSVTNQPIFHLQEMAGIGCLEDRNDIKDEEIHDALMQHEWFHLIKDSHLSNTEIEIEADKAAIESMNNPSLKQAWVDARIVGGFMWPFASRQNGLALIDNKFDLGVYQDTQMQTVHEWCGHVLQRFYTPEIAAQIIHGVDFDSKQSGSALSEDVQEFFQHKFWDKPRNEIESMDYNSFRTWFKEGCDKETIDNSWCYLTQAYTMHLQVSNAHRPEFYKELYKLSGNISESFTDNSKVRAEIHSRFREALNRLLPEASKATTSSESFKAEVKDVQLPGSRYRLGPFENT